MSRKVVLLPRQSLIKPLPCVKFEERTEYFRVEDADPVIRAHAIHWLLCIETYKSPRRFYISPGWTLIYEDVETCIYKEENQFKVIVAFRGTKAAKDIYDDTLLSLRDTYPRVEQATEYIRDLKRLNLGIAIELTGHSLGGAIARDVGKRLSIKSVTFNAAAPPSNPALSPGVDYHIVFDMISAWQSPGTIRIDKGYRPRTYTMGIPYIWAWSILEGVAPAHALKNFANTTMGPVVTANAENREIQKWFLSLPIKGRIYLLFLLGVRGIYTMSLPTLIE